MEKIKNIIQKLNLNVSKIETVPESFSSEVYKIVLNNGEKAYVKIPFNKNKLYKEKTMLERLESKLPESACGGSSEIDFTKVNRYVWGDILKQEKHFKKVMKVYVQLLN